LDDVLSRTLHGPAAWNSLPEDIRAESDIAAFLKLLKHNDDDDDDANVNVNVHTVYIV